MVYGKQWRDYVRGEREEFSTTLLLYYSTTLLLNYSTIQLFY